MHDQRKVKEELDEKTRLLTEEKISRFRQLSEECFALRAAGTHSREALQKLDLLLELNPELYTMCNYRRNILLALWQHCPTAAAIDEGVQEPHRDGEREAQRKMMMAADLEAELELSNRIVTKDYKVYSAWVHRKWIIEQLDPQRQKEVLLGENKKCEMLLKVDERNFHVWGYRRWVTQLLCGLHGVALLDHEWSFSRTKIDQNFSNYSAWHNRALILGDRYNSEVLCMDRHNDSTTGEALLQVREGLVTTIGEELALAERAFYADPNDQSAWFYARYLLGLLKGVAAKAPHGQAAYTAGVEQLKRACTEIIAEAEADEQAPPWPMLTLRLIQSQHRDKEESQKEEPKKQCEEALSALVAADKQRLGYYQDLFKESK
jgi:geranylgeranyl transferase type-2 subunit alpha